MVLRCHKLVREGILAMIKVMGRPSKVSEMNRTMVEYHISQKHITYFLASTVFSLENAQKVPWKTSSQFVTHSDMFKLEFYPSLITTQNGYPDFSRLNLPQAEVWDHSSFLPCDFPSFFSFQPKVLSLGQWKECYMYSSCKTLLHVFPKYP